MQQNLPAVRALFVVGADGFIIQDSDYGTPRRNLADRDYFQAHVNEPDGGLYIGTPLISRSVGTRFVGLSRRVEIATAINSGGRFGRRWDAPRMPPMPS